MFDISLTYTRKNGKTKLQELSFKRLIRKLSKCINPDRVTISSYTPQYSQPILLDTIDGSEMMRLAIQSAHEVDAQYPPIPNGISESAIADGSEHGIYITNETDEVVSLIVWYLYSGSAWLATGWTHPEHRNKGLYTTLYERLKRECSYLGIKSIGCGIKGGNSISLKTHKALGMEVEVITCIGQV